MAMILSMQCRMFVCAEGGDAADQWPPCGHNVAVGSSNEEPVLVLGARKVAIERGLKDDDCALIHEHVYDTRGIWLPWLKGVGMSLLVVIAILGAIHQKLLPNHGLPLPGSEKTPLPEPVKCEKFARLSTVLALFLGMLLVLLPGLARRGALPFLLTVCMASALLLRDPRVMVCSMHDL